MTTSEDETYAVPTLSRLMECHGNDWDPENDIFRRITSRDLDDERPLKRDTLWNLLNAWDVGRRISLVIPAQLSKKAAHLQLTLRALRFQTFFGLHPRHSILEIVVVNDGPATPDDVFQVAKYKPDHAELRVFCLKERLQPARARNVGLHYSRGDIVFFLDSDMLLDPGLIAEHIIRHEYIPNLALLSFRSDVGLDDAERKLNEAEAKLNSTDSPDDILMLDTKWEKDWKARKHKITKSSTINGKVLRVGQKVSIYEVTDRLRNWDGPFFGDGPHYDRNLPSAFATSCVSVRREHVMAVGGFRSHYYGWGIEDRDLGSRLLGRGVRLIVVRSVGARHIRHQQLTRGQKKSELEENMHRYNSLMHEPYHENAGNLIKQITDLHRDNIIYPALEFVHGTALPRTQKLTHIPSPLDLTLETILRQADSYFRLLVRGIGGNKPADNVAVGDLKWRVVLEHSLGGELLVRVGINLSNRRDGSLRLTRGAGWVGFVVQSATARLRDSDSRSMNIALRPITVNFTSSNTKAVQIAHRGLLDADRERTDYYKFLSAAPIMIPLEWPGQSHYCIGAVSVHSASSLDVMQTLASEDLPIVEAIERGASATEIATIIESGVSSPGSDLLREFLRDLAYCCGDLLAKHWTETRERD